MEEKIASESKKSKSLYFLKLHGNITRESAVKLEQIILYHASCKSAGNYLLIEIGQLKGLV